MKFVETNKDAFYMDSLLLGIGFFFIEEIGSPKNDLFGNIFRKPGLFNPFNLDFDNVF
jgi:hypothetical protein